MGAINAMLRGFRALKNANTGGRGLSGLTRGESWINPMQVNLKTGEIGRKIKDGVSLDKAKESLKLDKDATFVGSKQFKDGSGAHFIAKDAKGNLKYANTKGETLPSGNAKVFLKSNKNDKDFNYAPFRYDTDALTKKSTAIGLGTLGAIGYGVNGLLSSDNESEPAKAQNSETASNTENDSKNGNGFGIADAEPTGLFKSGVDKLTSTPKASTDVTATNTGGKSKKGTGKLNYDPIAEWAKADQATNEKWNKRRENYNRMVGEGVDPYEAYDRSMQEQPTKPAPTANTFTNTSKPAQNNSRLSYNPMFTDQAIELRRKQQGKN